MITKKINKNPIKVLRRLKNKSNGIKKIAYLTMLKMITKILVIFFLNLNLIRTLGS